MTAPVDVLAVMAEMITCYGSTEECPDDTAFIAEAEEARAAVAELMDQADTLRRILHNAILAGEISVNYGTHLADMEAALARCGVMK